MGYKEEFFFSESGEALHRVPRGVVDAPLMETESQLGVSTDPSERVIQ